MVNTRTIKRIEEIEGLGTLVEETGKITLPPGIELTIDTVPIVFERSKFETKTIKRRDEVNSARIAKYHRKQIVRTAPSQARLLSLTTDLPAITLVCEKCMHWCPSLRLCSIEAHDLETKLAANRVRKFILLKPGCYRR